MFKIYTILYTSFFLVSCSNVTLKDDNSDKIINATDTANYTYNTFRENSSYFIKNEDRIDTTYYKIVFPVFDKTSLNDTIKKNIFFDGEQTPAEAAQSFIDGFNEFITDSHSDFFNPAWFKEVNSQVLLNTPQIITLETQIYEFTGGAHGHHHTFFTNIDAQNEKLVKLQDIIPQEKINNLTKIAEKYFRKSENLSDSTSLDKDYFFENGIFTINDNFGMTKDKLIIFYNEYEIKPYSSGPTRLEIPYHEIKNLLNTQGQKYFKGLL